MLAIAVSCVFVGCGSKNTSADKSSASTASTKAVDDSFTKIQAKGTVVIGVDDEFPPMGFKDDNGNIVGFDVDFAKAACAKLGLKAEIKKISWDAKEMELSTGKIDMIWNGYTITDDRAKKVLFSKPYLENNQVIIVAANSTIKSKADLAGKKVGLQKESSAEDALTDKANEAIYKSIGEDNVKKYPTNVEAFMDLKVGRVDAVIVDQVVANYQATKDKGQFVVLKDSLAKEQYGVGFRKEDKALRDKFQGAIDTLIKEGKTAEISNQWFGSDIVMK
jgi:ABC-type amino acid transport/signal transduction systems, periplasmic component/domain